MNWQERNEAWEGRARALGERAVLHVGHKTPEAQEEIYRKQRETILPILRDVMEPLEWQTYPVKILDFGCGVGRWADELSAYGPYTGIDPTERFLEICRTKRPEKNFQRYENGRIPFADEFFDVVFACMVLSTILDVEGGMFEHTVKEIDRVLAPHGMFFLVDNTLGRGGREVRSPFSISRTVEQYKKAFAKYDLAVAGQYEDLGEINTVFFGYKP